MGYWGMNYGAAWIDGVMSGLLLGKYGEWVPILIILVFYHIVLAWVVMNAKHDTGLSLSIPATIVTHLACLVIVVGLGSVIRQVPLLRLIRYAIPALAPFERDWLFKARKGSKKKDKVVTGSKQEAAQKAAAVANAVAAAATVDDYEEWLKYLAKPNRPPRKPGLSVQDEYKQWLVARARAKVAPRPQG
jgi:hypothetical protein